MRLIDILTDSIRGPIVLACVIGIVRVIYATISRIVQPYPRARATVEAAAALSPDVLRFGLQMWAAWTGRPAPKLDALPAAPLDAVRLAGRYATAADLQDALDAAEQESARIATERDALARRVAELTAGRTPDTLRPTVVPGEGPAEHDDRPAPPVTSRHRIVGTTLATLCLALAGCPKLPPVSGCAPLSQRCDGDRPQVCSSSQRWHFVGDEPCGATAGQSCAVRNGVAGCAR